MQTLMTFMLAGASGPVSTPVLEGLLYWIVLILCGIVGVLPGDGPGWRYGRVGAQFVLFVLLGLGVFPLTH